MCTKSRCTHSVREYVLLSCECFKKEKGLHLAHWKRSVLYKWWKKERSAAAWPPLSVALAVSCVMNWWLHLLILGATDVRSTMRIVEAQKEKCDELRQQFHVLQERVQYLAQLKETLLSRLNQLIEAQAMSSATHSTRPTPRFLDELFHDDMTAGSVNGEQRAARELEEIMEQQLDLNEALASLASDITKICSQVNCAIRSAFSCAHMNQVTRWSRNLRLPYSRLPFSLSFVK